MDWDQLLAWFMSLGEPYGVNPVIFGAIYLGTVPFFWGAILWIVHNIRHKRQVYGPVLTACGCNASPYVYVIIVGENVPLWVYGLITCILGYALYSTLRKVRSKMKQVMIEENLKS